MCGPKGAVQTGGARPRSCRVPSGSFAGGPGPCRLHSLGPSLGGCLRIWRSQREAPVPLRDAYSPGRGPARVQRVWGLRCVLRADRTAERPARLLAAQTARAPGTAAGHLDRSSTLPHFQTRQPSRSGTGAPQRRPGHPGGALYWKRTDSPAPRPPGRVPQAGHRSLRFRSGQRRGPGTVSHWSKAFSLHNSGRSQPPSQPPSAKGTPGPPLVLPTHRDREIGPLITRGDTQFSQLAEPRAPVRMDGRSGETQGSIRRSDICAAPCRSTTLP